MRTDHRIYHVHVMKIELFMKASYVYVYAYVSMNTMIISNIHVSNNSCMILTYQDKIKYEHESYFKMQ